jgi:hypothetical protein
MHKISYILIVVVLAVFIYTGIYGCGCNEKFEDTIRFDTKAVKDIKKVIDASIIA